MKRIALCTLALLLGSSFAALDPEQKCRKKSEKRPPFHVREELTPVNALPESFTWGNKEGTNYLTNIKNQHVP